MKTDPKLYSLFNRYLASDLTLAEFEQELVPFVPRFAELAEREPIARLVTTVDEMLVDIGLSQSTEEELRNFLASSPALTPTEELVIGDSWVESGADAATSHIFTSTIAFSQTAGPRAGLATTGARTQLAEAYG